MAVASDSSGSLTDSSLLLNTAKTLHEVAKLLRSDGVSRESKKFYTNFMAHCVLIRHHVNRVKSSIPEDYRLLVGILNRFEAIVTSSILDTRPLSPANIYPRLRALNQAWNKVRYDSDDNKRLFIQKSVDFVCDTDQPDKLNEFLEGWEDEITEQYPDDPSLWADDHVPQRKSRGQPSYAVWNASQSLFRALLESKECECDPMHEVGVRLFLSTFRKLPSNERDPADSDYDFEIFLSVQKEWHEANVHVAKTGTAIRFTKEDPSKKKLPAMKVKNLCEPIKKRKQFDRIKLRVDDDGILWKLRSEKCCFAIDESKPPVSLQQFIQDQYRSLTDKTKRILAVVLGYTVLYLHETPWLPSTWGPSSILFFHTTSSSIPLKPFIQTKLAHDHTKTSEAEDIDPDDFDPDDLDPDDIMMHQCPHLVTLGIVLMELYLATTFEELAEKYNIPLNERTRSIDAELVFSKCKSEIPENSQFHCAVEKCLDPKVWEDENGARLDDQTLKITIYQEVIRPLEDELNHAFSYIPIEDLDRIAQSLDLGSWGQIAQQVNARPVVAAPKSPNESIYSVKQQQQLFLPGQWHVGTPLVVPIFQQSVPNQITLYHEEKSGQLDYKRMRFFDDETVSEEHSAEARTNYSNWRHRFKEVYEQYTIEPPEIPVKIAILDTGIDQTHPDIDACTEQIKGQYNWTNEKFPKHVDDHNGHGTFTAGLLLEYLPDAELYIAKISDGNPCSPENIAKAIDYAIDEWNVDIISMSFGFPTREIKDYDKLEGAIHKAYSNHTLLFAAASNSGANLDRAYPARDENVICIHSTDANGNRSKFSPTALADALNLATVGEAVESSWPLRLCEGNNSLGTKYKSGTSFATPIAVSIAAFLLQYVRTYVPDYAHMLKRQSRMKAVLNKISGKTQESRSRDDYHYVAISRYSDNLFGKEREFINYTLRDLLSQ
ncbi:hypothetical protein EYB26_009173 [Talaromyces marneffei]|uniref:uncharacterized protein n=1 Tax=Talaromyces marneffei TaxID=37727 RepID=UPI0012A88873|nr:uncharacterized protein EYB26_009173 [Talaromyces marneffei]QGA21462.1 hypothetical protein EYB26_009173 [Talaromyces marneffei]